MSDKLTQSEVRVLVASLVAVNFIFFISSAYVTCSNDGSHFALVSAIVEKHSFRIADYMNYTRGVDYALKDGEYYSDRMPGTAFLSVPFFYFGELLKDAGIAGYLSSRDICEVFVIFLPNISGTLAVLYLFKFFRVFRFDFRTSLFFSILFAFSTLAWLESTHLFSHAMSMAATLAAAYYVVRLRRVDRANLRQLVVVSALLALSSILEAQNILFVGVFGFYVLLSGKVAVRSLVKRDFLVSLLPALAVFLAVYSTLLLYNFVSFGEITIKNSKYNPEFPAEQSFSTALAGNPVTGLNSLFLGTPKYKIRYNCTRAEGRLLCQDGEPRYMSVYDAFFIWGGAVRNSAPGLFIASPILLLSIPGFYYFYRKYRNEALFFLAMILTESLIVSFHTTSTWTRLVTTILPFLFLPMAFPVRRVLDQARKARDKLPTYGLLMVFAALAIYSTGRSFYIMESGFGHSLAKPLQFTAEIPSYILFYGTLLALYAAASAAKNRLKIGPLR